MIFDAQGKWQLERRNVEQGKPERETLPVEFLVFVPVKGPRGEMALEVQAIVLEKGELTPCRGKLRRVDG